MPDRVHMLYVVQEQIHIFRYLKQFFRFQMSAGFDGSVDALLLTCHEKAFGRLGLGRALAAAQGHAAP